MIKMPVMEPIVIKTKGLGFFARVWKLISVKRDWMLKENYMFTLKDGTNLIIPKGFIFDGASVPKPLWFILDPVGLLLVPGIIHDYAYRYDFVWAEKEGSYYKYKKGAGQKFWDKLFLDVSMQINDMVITDRIAYYSLRLFGFMAWNENRKKASNEINL